MIDLATATSSQRKYNNWLFLQVVIGLALLLYVGIPALIVATVLHKLRLSKHIFITLSLISLLLTTTLFANPVTDWWLPPQSWWVSFLLSPYIVLLLQGIIMFSRFAKPLSQQEQLAEQARLEALKLANLSRQAGSRRALSPESTRICIGAKVRAERFPAHVGIHIKDGWVLLDETVFDQHLFILGATGTGKSETIKRLVYELLSVTNRDIFFVDGKGDETLVNDLRTLAYYHQRGRAPVFKLGFTSGGAIYNGFRGQPTDIYNRLCALLGITEIEGDARYYADVNRDLLQLICYAPQGAPRNFEELAIRVDREWLLAAYKDNPQELKSIRLFDKKLFQGLLHRIRPLTREFANCIGEDGFALENVRCAIFSMRTQSVGDTAQRFLDFLVEDIKDFIGKRQIRPAVFIIDEFAQFNPEGMNALLSLARSSKLAIVLATQDVATLKDEQTRNLILANTRTKILMASDFPEPVGKLAGTKNQIESSVQLLEGDTTGLGSGRIQHAFKVDMNKVAQLPPGEAYLIRQRYVAHIRIRQVEKLDSIPPQQEEKRQRKTKPKPRKRPRTLE